VGGKSFARRRRKILVLFSNLNISGHRQNIAIQLAVLDFSCSLVSEIKKQVIIFLIAFAVGSRDFGTSN
jgi:hypothetical protein